MLKRPTPSPMQWMAATLLALGLSASAGYAAWAAQPAQVPGAMEVADQPSYVVDVRMDVDGNANTVEGAIGTRSQVCGQQHGAWPCLDGRVGHDRGLRWVVPEV